MGFNADAKLISAKYRFNLDDASAGVLINTSGNLFLITDASSAAAEISAEFRSKGAPQIGPLQFQNREMLRMPSQFDRVQLSWAAQAGQWVEVTTVIQLPAPDQLEYIRQGQINVSGIADPIFIAANQKFTIDGGATPSFSVVSVSTATNPATLIAAANADRKELVICNHDAVNDLFIGGSNVTTTTGLKIPPGGSRVTQNRGAYYGVVATGTLDVGVEEDE